ncbi:MAG: uroporphyrinogen-III synthase [Pseudomonadota bacterium]
MKVIVTRPQPDADRFAAQCRAHGLDPVISPLMEVRLYRDVALPAGAGALAFTSANGVRAFAALVEDRSLRAFCVGRATRDAAREAGFDQVTTAGGDVAALAAGIDEHRSEVSGAVCHIGGRHRAGDLVAALTDRGINAVTIDAYEAVAATALSDAAIAALRSQTGAAVALFSPRTARLFLELAENAGLAALLKNHVAACLSDAVADASRGARWADVRIAKAPDAASLVAALAKSA